MAAGAELLGGPTGAGSGGNRRWHGGAAGGVGISGQRVLHLQGADPAAANRGGERQLPARSPAAQLTPAQEAAVAAHIATHPDITPAALQTWPAGEHAVRLSNGAMWPAAARLGLSLKKKTHP